MSQLNPIAGSILQSIQAQRQVGVEKERQVRREQILEKNIAAEDDRFEHQVESSDIVTEAHDGHSQQNKPDQQKRRPKKDGEDEEPRLDLTA